MLFDEESLKEIVYIHEVDCDIEIGNFLYVAEDFYIPFLKFYKSQKYIIKKDGIFNEYSDLKRENVLIPKGLILKVDNIIDNKIRDENLIDNKNVVFSCLLKYNKSLKEDDLEVLANKFKVRKSNLNGLKFNKIRDVKSFIRKYKIEILLNSD